MKQRSARAGGTAEVTTHTGLVNKIYLKTGFNNNNNIRKRDE